MNKSAPPTICEKCHTRRLSPVLDKGHRWCKKCRAAEYRKLTQKPDERRKSRAGYEYVFSAVASLLCELNKIRRVIPRHYDKVTLYTIIRYKSRTSRRRRR